MVKISGPSLRFPLYRALLAAASLLPSAFALAASAPPRPNVLFLVVDDLRPTLGCYGAPVAVTPHLYALVGITVCVVVGWAVSCVLDAVRPRPGAGHP